MRIDVPTLKCDRCGGTTQDENYMSQFTTLKTNWHGYDKREDTEWDLCPSCFAIFKTFLADGKTEDGEMVRP